MSLELDLFSENDPEPKPSLPLAARMRPTTLQEFVGHSDLFGKDGFLSCVFKENRLPVSVILWGPPGSGKTTLARLLAQATHQRILEACALTTSLKELRDILDQKSQASGPDILFIDEIHRFNKTQQDALLPALETGSMRLIGATTENPNFEMRKALLSRCRLVRLEKLETCNILGILKNALASPLGLGSLKTRIDESCLQVLAQESDGDARTALTLLELAINQGSYDPDATIVVNEKTLSNLLSDQKLAYHKDSDRRSDLVSAYIKSIRASKPDAALYWLACMLAAGECPKYIFRRLLVAASEDIGLADPSAIAVVTSCASAFEWVGLPEGKYHLSQATLYLATANKSQTTASLFAAEAHLHRFGPQEVPIALKNTGLGGQVGTCLPESMNKVSFYSPGNKGYEAIVYKRVGTQS